MFECRRGGRFFNRNSESTKAIFLNFTGSEYKDAKSVLLKPLPYLLRMMNPVIINDNIVGNYTNQKFIGDIKGVDFVNVQPKRHVSWHPSVSFALRENSAGHLKLYWKACQLMGGDICST